MPESIVSCYFQYEKRITHNVFSFISVCCIVYVLECTEYLNEGISIDINKYSLTF